MYNNNHCLPPCPMTIKHPSLLNQSICVGIMAMCTLMPACTGSHPLWFSCGYKLVQADASMAQNKTRGSGPGCMPQPHSLATAFPHAILVHNSHAARSQLDACECIAHTLCPSYSSVPVTVANPGHWLPTCKHHAYHGPACRPK